MKKHAFLIMAHTQPELLKSLLILLDDERNDIYIHVDLKAKDFPIEELKKVLKRAKCVFTERTDVKWGTYSQINCEMVLLKEATKEEHSYYHLLSGMDLPIKPQNEIHSFFETYDGLEFIGEDLPQISEAALTRVKYNHKLFDKNTKILRDIPWAVSVKIQKLLKVDLTKNYENIIFQKGRNWFSITHGLAKLAVEREDWIKEVFGKSVCGDELFLQTIARNSEYKDKICNMNTMPEIPDTRYIDWKRGDDNHPYIFRQSDFEELINADAFFARKFDLNVDKKIVEKLCANLK